MPKNKPLPTPFTPVQVLQIETNQRFHALEKNFKAYNAHLVASQNIILALARLLKVSPALLAEAIASEGPNKRYEEDTVREVGIISEKLKESMASPK